MHDAAGKPKQTHTCRKGQEVMLCVRAQAPVKFTLRCTPISGVVYTGMYPRRTYVVECQPRARATLARDATRAPRLAHSECTISDGTTVSRVEHSPSRSN